MDTKKRIIIQFQLKRHIGWPKTIWFSQTSREAEAGKKLKMKEKIKDFSKQGI
jgi:hypothetical protein